MNSLQSFLYVDFGGPCLVQFLLERITNDRNGWTIIAASMEVFKYDIYKWNRWQSCRGQIEEPGLGRQCMVAVIIFIAGYMVHRKMNNWIITIYQLYIRMCVVINI